MGKIRTEKGTGLLVIFFGFRGVALGFRVKKNQRAAKLLAVSGKSIKRVLAEGENLLEIP